MFRSLLAFIHATRTTELYTLSLHDALPISIASVRRRRGTWVTRTAHASTKNNAATSFVAVPGWSRAKDRKSIRLNSSHLVISYAVFCLKKKNITKGGLKSTGSDALGMSIGQ